MRKKTFSRKSNFNLILIDKRNFVYMSAITTFKSSFQNDSRFEFVIIIATYKPKVLVLHLNLFL